MPVPTPPGGFDIPKGFATIVAQTVAAVAYVIALVTAVIHGDHSQETISATIVGTVVLVTMLWGRYKQAAALLGGS